MVKSEKFRFYHRKKSKLNMVKNMLFKTKKIFFIKLENFEKRY